MPHAETSQSTKMGARGKGARPDKPYPKFPYPGVWPGAASTDCGTWAWPAL